MKLIFVRHGKDDENYRGGWSNLDLIPEGIQQAKLLADHLQENEKNYNIVKIIASDLPRTVTTAYYISSKLGIPLQKEPLLREINNGDLAGMLNETALIRYPGLFFNTLDMNEAYPNGESPIDFYLRIQTWFHGFCTDCRNINGNILVVTHSGVINIIYHLVNKMEWSNKGLMFKAANCGIHILNTESMAFEIQNKTDFLSEQL